MTDPGEDAGEDDEGPLAGLTVVEFAGLLPAPYATQVMADLGADVVKVEPPAGDEARRFPSGLYAAVNRNKRGIVADLKDERDRAACLRLVAGADVVVEGFRPGVAARLGISYADVRAVNPDVVYCSVSGFGQTGPHRAKAGHDLTYLAVSGGLGFSAHWGEPPRRSGVPVADLAGSTHAVIAVLSALRRRDRTGRGCHLDVAIADATMAFVSPRGGPSFSVANEQRLGVYPTNDLYRARDGVVLAVAAVEEKFWGRLRDVLTAEVPELADPRFDTEDGRRQHGDALKEHLEVAFRRRTGAEWVAIFERADVPVDRVVTLAEAAAGPQATSRGIVATRDGERHVVFPVVADGKVLGRLRRTAPALGEHTQEVLTP